VGVNAVCRLLGISKKSYYYSEAPDVRLNRRYCKLKGIISSIIKDNPSYGYRRLQIALKEEHGVLVNHKLLKKLLKLWGLEFRRKIKKPSCSLVRKILVFLVRRVNLLFAVKSGNIFKVIVSDITEIIYKGGKAYLSVYLDLLGKMVYGWEVSLHSDAILVVESFKKASRVLKRYLDSVKGIIFHQDQGSAYTSELYLRSVINHGGVLSYSRRGEPGDNAVNESFFFKAKG
jgi:putative transposase